MAFTYLGTLATDRDKVRSYLRDTVSAAGPLPADANFTDAEIDGLITTEGTWQRAVAAGFELLVAAWSRYVNFNADGVQVSRSDVAKSYQVMADKWRRDYGRTVTGRVGSRAVTRADGYSDDYDNVTA